MKKILLVSLIALSFIFTTIISFNIAPSVYADEVEALQKQIDDLNKSRQLSEAATKPLEGQLESLRKQLAGIRGSLNTLSTKIKTKDQELADRTEALAEQQLILETRVRSYYIRSYATSPLIMILSSENSAGILRDLSYRLAATKEDQRIITSVTNELKSLAEEKAKLEKDKKSMASLQVQVDKNATFIDGEIDKAKAYQEDLKGKVAALSAQQQSILSARSGSFTATIGDSELADDYNASIKGFRESAPSGSFAVFSFGAHTHRKGMSQYGARGRAGAGQDFKTILKAYYGKEPVSKDTGGTIKVAGQGDINFEEKYLYGIAEMPATWHKEALKAQAVAARTYAYRYKAEGKEICITEACQVYSSSKAANAPEAWKQAVNETKGQVLEDVVTYYASTHGAFTTTTGWDTTDGSGGGNFIDKAWEKTGGSPWLYKAWYTKGYSASSDKCGRSNPWLNGEELADIINAALYRDDRVTPVTTSCWGGNPYSYSELRSKANGPSTVTGVTVAQGNGTTGEITFQTDKGTIKLSGSDFKTAFNVRAPGYMSIPQSSFAFFNIERK